MVVNAQAYVWFVAGTVALVLSMAVCAERSPSSAGRAGRPGEIGSTHDVCIARSGGLLRGRVCGLVDRETGDPVIRRLYGLPICWWTAETADFEGISGVGRSTAVALARYRDVGGQPDAESLQAIHRIGAKTAPKIAEWLTTDCRRLP